MRRQFAGISLFEFAVVVIVVSALVLPLLAALGRYQGVAERQMVDLDIRAMQTSLRLKVMDLMVTGKRNEIDALAGSNPIALLGQLPKGYIGEVDGVPSSAVSGNWFFDRKSKVLVYVPSSFSFVYQPGETKELRWELQKVQGSEMSIRLVPIVKKSA